MAEQFIRTARGYGEVILSSTRREKVGGEPPAKVRLFQTGENRYDDGTFLYTDRSKKEVLSYYKDKGTDPVWDWEHQTLLGDRAPAAGWITSLDGLDDGLWSGVDWTDDGAKDLRTGAYRYFSCVFDVDTRTNEIIKLHHVALTNWPGEKGQAPLTERVAASARAGKTKREKQGGCMDELMERLMWFLGLPITATHNDARASLQKILDAVPADDQMLLVAEKRGTAKTIGEALGVSKPAVVQVAQKAILDELELPETATLAQAHAKVGDLKTSAAEVVQLRDENKTLKEKLATSSAKTDDDKIALLIQTYRTRVTPAKEAWVRSIAKRHGIEHATEVVKSMAEALPANSERGSDAAANEDVPVTVAQTMRIGSKDVPVDQESARRVERVKAIQAEDPDKFRTFAEAAKELVRREARKK